MFTYHWILITLLVVGVWTDGLVNNIFGLGLEVLDSITGRKLCFSWHPCWFRITTLDKGGLTIEWPVWPHRDSFFMGYASASRKSLNHTRACTHACASSVRWTHHFWSWARRAERCTFRYGRLKQVLDSVGQFLHHSWQLFCHGIVHNDCWIMIVV